MPEDTQEQEALCQQLSDVAEAGRTAGLTIHYRLPAYAKKQKRDRQHIEEDNSLFTITERQVCSENVQHAAFIGVTGKVSPCVFVNLPTTAPPPHPSDSLVRPYYPLEFGSIATTSFEKIWHSQPYVSFRKAHYSGTIPSGCEMCAKFAG